KRDRASSLGGTSMVSKSGRRQNIRQNRSHGGDNGGRTAPRGGVDLKRPSPGAAHPAAGDALGGREAGFAGALALLVAPGEPALEGRSDPAAGASPLGHSVNKNLFIAGTRGVGKTQLLREATLSRK